MLVDTREVFLRRMASTVRNVRQKEGPLAGAVRASKLNLSKTDKVLLDKFIFEGVQHDRRG